MGDGGTCISEDLVTEFYLGKHRRVQIKKFDQLFVPASVFYIEKQGSASIGIIRFMYFPVGKFP